MSSRIEWIDALKGFAIFTVVLGHCITDAVSSNTFPAYLNFLTAFKDFIYSFEHNLEMSDSFTRIIFDKEEENFICREDISTKNGIVSLFGTLDIDGFLLNEAMYAPMFRKEFYVDPFNVPKRIPEIKEKLQAMMYKKIDDEKQRAINEYECDCHLARKKG